MLLRYVFPRNHNGYTEGQDYSRWATMTQLKDSQSFLGFANFYQWFIKGFLRFVQPLIALMCKDSPFHGTMDAQNASSLLKQASILLHPNPNKPF